MNKNSIADLAATLAKATTAPTPQPTIVQGVVTAWNSTASPPTVTVQLAGASAGNTTNLQYLESYWPTVGDVVQVVAQQGSHLVLGTIADEPATTGNGVTVVQNWTVPTPLGGGVTSGAGGAGAIMYRVIMQGELKTQVKGSVAISGGASGSPFGLFTLNNLAAPDAVNRMIPCVIDVAGQAYIQYDYTDNVANLYGGTGATVVIVDGHEFFPSGS